MSIADQTLGNGSTERESFHMFFECWIVQQNQHLQELLSALKNLEETRSTTTQDEQAAALHPLLVRVINHYVEYYEAKSRWARNDILLMFRPSWLSSLEVAFAWIGGWRPTMAFHLLYSISGIQLESRLMGVLRRIGTADFGNLSSVQLNGMNDLQKETIKDEKEITEQYAKLQESIADRSMVHLAHVATRATEEGLMMNQGRIVEALLRKELGLVQVLKDADNLRLTTLQKVLSILTPVQKLCFLIAAAELHLRFHEWGKARDARALVHRHRYHQ